MKQRFRFAELYRNNRIAVEKTLSAMWCGEVRNESQKAYVNQLNAIIPEVFAPKDAMPLVQCMNSYESVYPENKVEAEEMLGTLWRKTMPKPDVYYDPYEHQYQCWKTLLKDKTVDGKPMSIVVTTGTGSGKTECFMLPLVQDLLDNFQPQKVQAIFLYPLNALMEDQKARMQKLLMDTELKFAVYNGDMPERLPSVDDKNYKKVLRKIDSIRGVIRDEQGNELSVAYPNIIATREELRRTPANILLTNPTMLEYIMLRDRDKNLINEKQNNGDSTLRWIALDETHTYTGAGATEIAMLLRRILLAYGVTTDEVRFATSSATIGNGGTETLKEFISGITGLHIDQIRCVNGKRKGVDVLPEKDREYWLRLINDNKDGYLKLDDLISEGKTIEEKLVYLDNMCQNAENEGLEDLRVKVHYFYRVPNHGLYVDISDPHYNKDGSFRIHMENNLQTSSDVDAPLLELSRCKHCGEYVAIAEEVKLSDGSIGYQPITMDDSDMFDLDYTEESNKIYYVFATTKNIESTHDNNAPYIIKGNRMLNVTAASPAPNGWRVIANTQCQCPYCGVKLTKQSNPDEENLDTIQLEEEDGKKLQKFRIAADFVSRLIAPSTLELMTEACPKDPQKISLHKGQQFISFVDSRQMAARSTIKQNLEEERLWVYSTIFHELCRRTNANSRTKEEAIRYYETIYDNTARKDPEHKIAEEKLNILEGEDLLAIEQLLKNDRPQQYLSWQDILELLLEDKYVDIFCQQFAERSELSLELDENGNIKAETKRRYILAIMVEYLSKRPLKAAAPETMGLFTSYYEKLKDVLNNNLPKEVEALNSKLSDENQIKQKDWHNLMQIFLDLTVRSNQSVFLKLHDTDSVDIFDCVRFATVKERRRSVHKPTVKDKGGNRSRIIRLIAKLIAKDKNISTQDAISAYKSDIQEVINCMWTELTNPQHYGILEHSTHYDEEIHCHVKDKDEITDGIHSTPYRLNLKYLGFKLYDEVYLCDTNTGGDTNHVEWLRPIATTFHGYSPYTIKGEVVSLCKERYDTWKPYNLPKFSKIEDIENWAKEYRKLLWNNDIWGDNGVFADRLLQIYQYPHLFIQAEHTAQVDKMISRQVQEDFKDHCINILACSTTMEMGVDLGDLELVMMTSVPPMPSNYKQRAGRSGRRGQIRSACVTLCGSDAVGIRTLLNPMENVVLRNVNTTAVDLKNEQVIQRHVNSFLIREFGVFGMAGGSIMDQVISYYTNYEIVPDGNSQHFKIKKKLDHAPVSPIDGLGDESNTPYEAFNKKCLEALSDELKRKLHILLNGTKLGERPLQYAVSRARKLNERCYSELELKIQDYVEPYKNAKSAKQQAFFELKFIEPLATRLLSYWATHRFIPNANMPVNVVEFDINSTTKTSYTLVTPSNPSYPLRTALAQYAPGNPIARDGMVRIVRGIRYTNFFKPEVTFKKLYFNREQVVIDTKDELDNLEVWKVSAKHDLDLLQPAEFIPDMNESASRILDKNAYTRVSAQLIGAGEWKQDRIEPHLFDSRNSRESGNGEILYYNEGTGFGYCHCTKCGKTVLESWAAASSSDPNKLPAEMNNIVSNDTNKPNYHFSLVKKGNKPSKCIGCGVDGSIKRNVVLGDTIQTDYTEIRIRHFQKNWINSRYDEENLLITLGLLFTRALSEEINIERTDLDFAITSNGHICVFDTNPGGSGYSNQLSAIDMIKAVIERSYSILEAAEKTGSKDAIIDKFTLHYLNYIDVKAAKSWIEEEKKARKVLPDNIKDVFGENVTETSLSKMLREFAKSQNERVIFVDDDYDSWEYENTNHSWKEQILNSFMPYGQMTSFCVIENTQAIMSSMALKVVRSIDGWANEVIHTTNPFKANNLYPLAYIDGRLYFTNNPNHITLNDKWGNGTIYFIKFSNIAQNAIRINTTIEEDTTKIFKLESCDPMIIKSSELSKLINAKAEKVISNFVTHCKNNDDQVIKIKYQDEHMKSVLSIIVCLQTIEYFIKLIGCEYTIEFFVERYDSDFGKRDSFTANQPSHEERDKWIEILTKELISNIDYENDINGSLIPVVSVPKRGLTHWRVLSFECAGKRLSIYPDGGFMNGWFMYNDPDKPRNYYNLSQITVDTDITITRNQDIKFDVIIEPC